MPKMERGEQEEKRWRERKGEVVGLSMVDRCQAMFCSMGDDVEPSPFEFSLTASKPPGVSQVEKGRGKKKKRKG